MGSFTSSKIITHWPLVTVEFFSFMLLLGKEEKDIFKMKIIELTKNIQSFKNINESPSDFLTILLSIINQSFYRYSNLNDFITLSEHLLVKYNFDILTTNERIKTTLNSVSRGASSKLCDYLNVYSDVFQTENFQNDYSMRQDYENFKKGYHPWGFRNTVSIYLTSKEDLTEVLKNKIALKHFENDYFETDHFTQYAVNIIKLARYFDIDYIPRIDTLINLMPTEVGILSAKILKERLIAVDTRLK
jgi:hypothetical protein